MTTPDDRNAKRIAQIEGWMSAQRGSESYRKYYDDPKVQAEYRALLSERAEREPWLSGRPD